MLNVGESVLEIRRRLVARFGFEPWPDGDGEKLGIAANVKSGLMPINGLRISPQNGTSGWFIWAGEEPLSRDADFFLPLHTSHLASWCTLALPFLILPPGWRFLVTPHYEDVWYDAELSLAGDD